MPHGKLCVFANIDYLSGYVISQWLKPNPEWLKPQEFIGSLDIKVPKQKQQQMCKLFPHMVLSLYPFSYLLPLSGKSLSLFWLSPLHTHRTQATPKSSERFCFPRAPELQCPTHNRVSLGRLETYDRSWSVPGVECSLECDSWHSRQTGPYHTPYYPRRKDGKAARTKGGEEGNADTEPVGAVEKNAGLTNQVLLEIHVCKTFWCHGHFRGFTPRASPGFFQMHFTIELLVDLFQWL